MPRTKQFDPERAVGQAVEVFWSQGYDGTSINDLLDAMGIHKGSFYDTFESKHNIYMLAMDRYLNDRFGGMIARGQGLDPKDAILGLFEAVKAECTGKLRDKGCFAVNCALERAPIDDAARMKVRGAFRFHEQVFVAYIKAGQEAGSIARDIDPEAAAKVLLGLTMAMRVYGKTGADAATLDIFCRQARAALGET